MFFGGFGRFLGGFVAGGFSAFIRPGRFGLVGFRSLLVCCRFGCRCIRSCLGTVRMTIDRLYQVNR